MISRMSKMPQIEPLYAVSLGNQIDLTASDYLNYLKDEPEVRIFAVYIEGFKPGRRLAFARAVEEITARGRTVVVYKSGRSPEGRGATSSHTASVAGDYNVCRAILKQAGAIVPRTSIEFESFVRASHVLGRQEGQGEPGRPRQQRRVRVRDHGGQPEGRRSGTRPGGVRAGDAVADRRGAQARSASTSSRTSTIRST